MKKLKVLLFTLVCFAALSLALASCNDATPPGIGGGGGGGGSNSSQQETLDSISGLANKLEWLFFNAKSNSSYIVDINTDESIGSQTIGQYIGYSDRSNITIIIRGVGSNRTISRSSPMQCIFTVDYGNTLVLDNNITLSGGNNVSDCCVRVYSNGNSVFRMNEGSAITGNSRCGVYVAGGTFIMDGGVISGNTGVDGGGVGIRFGGTLIMNGGSITGNSASANYGSGNTLNHGGGVYIENGIFTMNGGVISDNTSEDWGGGVHVAPNGTFRMTGGTISSNTTTSEYGDGGGVSLNGVGASFNMSGGTISGNTADGGGGVSLVYGTFAMTGGTISGNTARTGGGVRVSSPGGIFTKTGGIIYGYEGETDSNRNTEMASNLSNHVGHAVHVLDSKYNKGRRTTAGPNDNLDSKVSGAAGGWEWEEFH